MEGIARVHGAPNEKTALRRSELVAPTDEDLSPSPDGADANRAVKDRPAVVLGVQGWLTCSPRVNAVDGSIPRNAGVAAMSSPSRAHSPSECRRGRAGLPWPDHG